jgi:hypothetical protein
MMRKCWVVIEFAVPEAQVGQQCNQREEGWLLGPSKSLPGMIRIKMEDGTELAVPREMVIVTIPPKRPVEDSADG